MRLDEAEGHALLGGEPARSLDLGRGSARGTPTSAGSARGGRSARGRRSRGAPDDHPRSRAARRARRIVASSPACAPQQMLAEVTRSRSASSQGKPSPRSAFRSIVVGRHRGSPRRSRELVAASMGTNRRRSPARIGKWPLSTSHDAQRRPAEQVPAAGRLARVDRGLPADDGHRAGRDAAGASRAGAARRAPRGGSRRRGSRAGTRARRRDIPGPSGGRRPRRSSRWSRAATSGRSSPS